MAWIWAMSDKCWRTGEPGMLQFMGSQRVRHNWGTDQQSYYDKLSISFVSLDFHNLDIWRLQASLSIECPPPPQKHSLDRLGHRLGLLSHYIQTYLIVFFTKKKEKGLIVFCILCHWGRPRIWQSLKKTKNMLPIYSKLKWWKYTHIEKDMCNLSWL